MSGLAEKVLVVSFLLAGTVFFFYTLLTLGH